MFSGIISDIGIVKTFAQDGESATVNIEASTAFSDVRLGESIAVNGVCLTVVQCCGRRFSAEISPETWRVTTLGALQPGDEVNLERSLCLNDRLGGHLVSGHVDGVGTIIDKRVEANAIHYIVQSPPNLLRLIVPKGSIAVHGISLTVVACHRESFQVTIIPHTAAVTTIGRKTVGASVNLECDMIGKFVERALQARLEGESEGADDHLGALLRQHRMAE